MSTNRSDYGFSEDVIEKVWAKGAIVTGNDPNVYRQDRCGAWMQRSKHGDRADDLGWEVDHIIPTSKGGTDDMDNLQPLQWINNSDKADGDLKCCITSKGGKNIKCK